MRIKVAYCGICHSDLSLIDGSSPAALRVVTQGPRDQPMPRRGRPRRPRVGGR
ncbi:alcohol dehydrogenase catalytic domain-containing protein [Mobilicoccus pelagius]|uniref:alcohol dehydrogenase catalytic domain-containing protein n=1 Tax=Mobilicoccus pelagius TaxID=746032 RepID=UPI0003063349